ncbi:hypothetical protein HN011_006413 [Eciton burchellii]|nr:hypothetical protein HN011_006413 [Eciton burchellii]
MYLDKVINKIPGDIPAIPKEQGQGYIDNLAKKQKFELEELLERQNKILANKNFISKLPDKGEKLINFRDKILKELQHKDEVEKVANLLSKLNIAYKGKAAMTKLEWTGKYDKNEDVSEVLELDSDDKEDPLHILAQSTKTGNKKVIREIPKESLIKPEDIEEINSFRTDLLNTQHTKHIIKVEETQKTNKKREPFKPSKRVERTNTNVHDSIKEKQRRLPKLWEVTATSHSSLIDLNESLKLQQEYIERRKMNLTKCAIERIIDQADLHIDSASKNIGSYHMMQHINNLPSSSTNEDDEDVYDEDVYNEDIYDEDDENKDDTAIFLINSTDIKVP